MKILSLSLCNVHNVLLCMRNKFLNATMDSKQFLQRLPQHAIPLSLLLHPPHGDFLINKANWFRFDSITKPGQIVNVNKANTHTLSKQRLLLLLRSVRFQDQTT